MTMDIFLFALKFLDRLRLAESQLIRSTFDVLLTRLRNRVLFWSTTGVQSSPCIACLICVPQSINRPSSQQLRTIASWKATMIFEENRWNSSHTNISSILPVSLSLNVPSNERWILMRYSTEGFWSHRSTLDACRRATLRYWGIFLDSSADRHSVVWRRWWTESSEKCRARPSKREIRTCPLYRLRMHPSSEAK